MIDSKYGYTNIVNIMNDNDRYKSTEFLHHQTNHFQKLIQEIVHCCDDRKLYESQKFFIPCAEIKCLTLFDKERSLTVKKIAQIMDVAKSRVTKLLENLENKGFVQSVSDPADARIKLVSLTQQGWEKAEEIRKFQKSIHYKILERFSEDERQKTLSCLESLRSAMEAVKLQLET